MASTYKGLTVPDTTPSGAAGQALDASLKELADRCEQVITVAASDATQTVKDMAAYECDGTDDDVQIQAALDALPNFTDDGRSGGVVRLSAGKFTFGSTVSLEGSRHIIGEGEHATQIYMADNSDCDTFESAPSSTQGFCSIRDLNVQGNQDNQTTGGWFWNQSNTNQWDSYIENVLVFRCKKGGVYVSNGWGWQFHRLCVEFCEGPGVKVVGASGPIFSGCKIIDNEDHAIHIVSGAVCHIRVHGCELGSASTSGSGIYVDDVTAGYVLATDTVFPAPPANGQYQCVLSLGSALSGCMFVGGSVADSKGIWIGGYNNAITGCRFTQHTGRAISCHNYDSYNNAINGNNFLMAAGGTGIYLDAARQTVMANNIINGATGIELTSYGDESIIIGNMLYNQSANGIVNNGQNNSVEHNITT